MMRELHSRRRDAIRHLLRSEVIGTQEELRSRLQRQGFDCTQATLSRDLSRLGARRVALTSGGTAYEIEDVRIGDEGQLAEARDLVVSVSSNGNLVVIHTVIGTAAAVGVAIDRARLEGVLGTIAGDDTLFVAPARSRRADKLAKQFQQIWEKRAKS